MISAPRKIFISGAGPAGLAAAITGARSGAQVTVQEQHKDVGHRFSGDFQGLENWTTEHDVLDELSSLGIEPTFEYTPFYEAVIFDPVGRERRCRDSKPIFYLVARGREEASIDCGLRDQALSLGVDLELNAKCEFLPQGGIVANGPKRADVIAVGYLFETDAADGAYCALSSRLAAKGYAYLLVQKGRGVIATCLFDDFHNERYYLGETVDFFESAVGIKMRHVRRFGGAGSYSFPTTARKGNLVYAGESAGFQDALAGFGMRYALLSGHFAARALLAGEPERYDEYWRERFGGQLRASVVNRYLFSSLGDPTRRRLAAQLAVNDGARARLKRRYAISPLKALLYPIARRAFMRQVRTTCEEPGCSCTWCRCHSTNSPAPPSEPDTDLATNR